MGTIIEFRPYHESPSVAAIRKRMARCTERIRACEVRGDAKGARRNLLRMQQLVTQLRGVLRLEEVAHGS